MKTFISILRRINVGGHRKILMKDLKELYEKNACQNVRTYVQSGNVVFECAERNSNISKQIEQAISEKYGFDVPIIMRTADQMQEIVSKNNFANQADADKVLVVFLAEEPKKERIEKIEINHFLPDQFQILGTEIYLFCPNGYGKTKLTNNFFENKLKVIATICKLIVTQTLVCDQHKYLKINTFTD